MCFTQMIEMQSSTYELSCKFDHLLCYLYQIFNSIPDIAKISSLSRKKKQTSNKA